MENIRAKLKRRFSHKDPNPVNYDEYDEADEDTQAALNKEFEEAETSDKHPYGKPGSLLNKLIMHGNKKTEEEITRKNAADAANAASTGSGTQASAT